VKIKLKVLLAAGFAAGWIAGPAAAAFAHVTTDPDTAAQGAEITLGFRSPNEEATAIVTQLEVDFPTDTPLLGVDVQPLPGWTAKVTEENLNPPVPSADGPVSQAVSQIVWTAAAGGGTPPGEFQEFQVLVQKLPTNTTQVVFKALQIYSDDTVVRWIDPITSSHPDPDHPTPILKLTPASGSGAAGGASPTASTSSAGSAVDARASATASSVDRARTLGVTGIVIGGLGLVVALVAVAAVAASRRRVPDDGPPVSELVAPAQGPEQNG
jgi:uncharacterized protein YcnI